MDKIGLHFMYTRHIYQFLSFEFISFIDIKLISWEAVILKNPVNASVSVSLMLVMERYNFYMSKFL